MQILLLHNLTYTWEKIKRALYVIATFSHFFKKMRVSSVTKGFRILFLTVVAIW